MQYAISLQAVLTKKKSICNHIFARHLLGFLVQSEINQADAPTIQMDATPSKLTGALTSAISTIFMLGAVPGTTLPIYPVLGQAPNMLACIPSGLIVYPVDCICLIYRVLVHVFRDVSNFYFLTVCVCLCAKSLFK